MYTVVEAEKVLLVQAPSPQELLGTVPGAFPFDHAGVHYVGMPHDVTSCIWLSTKGYVPPSPIESYYDWPRDKTLIPEPFKHQKTTAGFLTANPRAYCLNDIGTGKSLTAAWAADYLMTLGFVKSVLIDAPLSALERAWADTFFYHFRHRRVVVLHGSVERRRKLLAQPADFYIINPDGVRTIEKDLAARPDINCYIIDELASYRNKTDTVWKPLDRLIYPKHKPALSWVWGLTGKPIPNSPCDAFHQCKLVTPATVPEYYSSFRSMVMEKHNAYVYVPRPEAVSIVYQTMRPAIRYKRDDCLDLPGEIHSTLEVELSKEQQKHYKEISKDLVTDIRGGKVTALNEGIKLKKLLQIACGVVYSTEGVPLEIDCKPRIEELLTTIERIDEKVIVFVPFTNVTDMVAREVGKHWSTAVVYGDVPKKQRDQIFLDFQQKPDPSVLIAHPECMAHALTLTEASTIIWYAPIDSNDIYEQACGRITRAGQKYVANMIHLCGSAVERRAYKRLIARQKLQGLLLELVEKGELSV